MAGVWRRFSTLQCVRCGSCIRRRCASAANRGQRTEKTKPVDAELVADLLDALALLEADALRERAAASIIARAAVFDPGKVVVPALTSLHERNRPSIESEGSVPPRVFARGWHREWPTPLSAPGVGLPASEEDQDTHVLNEVEIRHAPSMFNSRRLPLRRPLINRVRGYR